ncbi:MAG: CDP-alcohol phosphatidyltransferase family protein [Candidatus Caenarcaniphilales bacterium]|nr:CDP-alcohol phosphatidyltransferase family protein [Candidatus Caenarcaniphilales bacterium]
MKFNNIPNLITFSRLLLSYIVIGILLNHELSKNQLWIALIGTSLVILGDYFDGLLARSLHQSSQFGGWFDIASDRLIEISFWIVFACIGWISPWIALIFLLRGVFVDGIRSFASQKGYSAFGKKTLQKSPLARHIVSSPFSRAAYAALKAITFCLIIYARLNPGLIFLVDPLVIGTLIYCLVRGLPVLIEGWHFFSDNSNST